MLAGEHHERALSVKRDERVPRSQLRPDLVANSMLADVVLAAAELQVAGERAGLKPDDVFWVLKRMAPVLAARRDGIVENRHAPTLFVAALTLRSAQWATPSRAPLMPRTSRWRR